ncbi:FAD-dependent oxidoreductase [Niabella sp. CC-SYL272]|uniref:FAD-dependent oxidoreductase n=1 Tax=Niabella agricola TaxID=2891571 RepID=UPI001F2832FA|nr:FAD-dependent oxidoreductase [Niabella agricola]MCF3108798.1 FAD-dependent oxidoreductase [Niabella agricola]
MRILFVSIFTILSAAIAAQNNTIPPRVNICVYGGTSAGVMAAYSAAKLGKTVVLIEPGNRLGGLTSGGLGFTDIGNKYAISGLALDFYRKTGAHYGRFEQWIFEPSVAEQLFKNYIKAAKVPVVYNFQLKDVKKKRNKIAGIFIEPTERAGGRPAYLEADIFIDCSYEGDLMAKAGVSYHVGREGNAVYKETYNGVQLMNKHQFPDGIDPYKIPGDASSGLLWGISNTALATTGSADRKVQAYNYRICLTNDPANRIPVTRPPGYDATKFELLLRYIRQANIQSIKSVLKLDQMPNHKTDINNNGPFSTDMIGWSNDYPEASYNKRKQLLNALELYNKSLLYFLGHDSRLPATIREQMLEWGYPKDEYTNNHHWTPQAYIRESRRMIGAYVMTQHNCQGRETVTDGVGVAAYTMDSHNCQRIVIEKDGVKMVKNEGDVQIGGFAPYPISYRAITPREQECNNLLVPVCLSASHIAYGSIRMEPVFMVLAQSAAVAACLAIDNSRTVQQIDVAAVQQKLQADPLLDGTPPDLIIDDADTDQVQFSGDWKRQTQGSYGPSMMLANTPDATARFLLPATTEGRYDVYLYLPRIKDAAREIKITVFDGVETTGHLVSAEAVKVLGQTSGEWHHIGNFNLKKGRQPYLQITAAGNGGTIAADALLLQQKR